MEAKISDATYHHVQRIYGMPKLYESLYGRFLESARRRAVDALPKKRPLKVLEVGVGSGLSFPYYDEGIELIGIDPNEKMLEVAKVKKASSKAHIDLQRMDGSSLAFEDHSFDAVLFLFVLTVVPSPEHVLAEARRVLKTGGCAIIASHFQGGIPLINKLTHFTKHIGYHTKTRLEDITHAPGWKLLRNDRIGSKRIVVLEKN